MEFTIKKSESIKNLAGKMLQVQKAGVDVSKSSVNPFFKSKYADLGEHIEAILPLCNDAGLWVSQLPSTTSLCTLIVDSDSGEWIEGYYPIIVTGKTPQEIASQVTYSRRYSLGCIFNANAVDDDGGSSSLNTTQAKVWVNKIDDAAYVSAKTSIEKGDIKSEMDLNARFNFNSKDSNAVSAKASLVALIKPTQTFNNPITKTPSFIKK